ncbi:CBS domain-containing protein [Halogranum amylolyticum]|uniref:CBS domain-containing protein n=1 Tax=Halogranum amylolyticum TaxID=660520 RepID=A0A1H8N4Q9_9EURY|nr:CBS domain-containing protein [Halogranum amylolyticum]SEO24615.1 CBS domain-containing protein [Halogranum amylolyticum]
MPLKDIVRPKEELVTASRDTSCQDLAKLMNDRTVGSVVIEENDEPIGIVTDRDICLNAVGAGKDPKTTPASEVMNTDVFTCDADDGVFELCQAMREHGVRRMPIVEDGKLSGIITLDDLVMLLEDEMHDLSEVIRSESPPYQPA